MKLKKGFSLFEMIIVITIIASLTAITIPSYFSFRNVNDLQSAFGFAVNTFISSQLKAIAGERDSQWGIKVNGGRIIIFKGNNYAGRDSSFDEITELPSSVSYSGATEIFFSKLTGYPSVTSTIILTNNLGKTKQFYLNEKGGLEY